MATKFIKILLAISLLIISIAIFYKFVVEPYQVRSSLEKCLNLSETEYIKNWNKSCKVLGFEEGCPLDKETASFLLRVYDKEKEECYRRFK